MKEFFNRVTIKDNLVVIPGTKKISKKLNKILENSTEIAISNELNKNDSFKNELYKRNVHILDGRYLFKMLCYDVIEFIIKSNEVEFENIEITLLANYLDDTLENNIILIAQKCKLLNIVTNNPEKFSKLTEKLQSEFGILIRVTKNRKKGLVKSGIVINADFPKELLNKCNFNNKAVLVNLNEKIESVSKSFNGINVNFYEINMENNEFDNYFTNEVMYESHIYKIGNFTSIRAKLKKDNIQIKNLIGINGPINIKEFKQNVLTKMEY